MSSKTGKKKKKPRNKPGAKGNPKSRKPKKKKQKPKSNEPREPLTEEQMAKIAEEQALKEAEEQKEMVRLANVAAENQNAHNDIINDYIAKFVDGAILHEIQTMEDVEEMEENEKPKPRHALTSFLEVLLDSEPNKRNLHRILTDQFLDNPLEFESLITEDTTDWHNEDYGGLNSEDWELDDNEVKRLMNEWRRNVLDPVMKTYQDRLLPWCPNVPIAQEIYDSYDEEDDGEEKEDIHTDTEHSRHDSQELKEEIIDNIAEDIPSDNESEIDMGNKEESVSDKEEESVSKEDSVSASQSPSHTPQSVDSQSDQGSFVSESMDESDEEPHIKTDESGSESEDEEEEVEEDSQEESGSADSGDSVDGTDWKELTLEEALEKDKIYAFGKRLTSASFPQYILQNIPSRFMSVNEDGQEQTHMAPVPWKRIFYHYNGDEIKLPNTACAKTVEAEYKRMELEVVTWDSVQKEEKNDSDGELMIVDRYLQEIPDNYDDILDCSLEVPMDDIYTLRKTVLEKMKRNGKKVGEMMQAYVDKFGLQPLPKNICSDTYEHPRFVCNMSDMKKYNEYGLINTKYEAMLSRDSDNEESESEDEEIEKDASVNDEIASAPWWTYRVRVWAKFTDKDWREANEEREEESEESESESDEDLSDNDDDDDDMKEEEKAVVKKDKRNGRYFTSKLSSDDPIGYKLLCDHFVVQNDHCFGKPTRFYWDEAIHEDYGGGSMDHRFGSYLTEDMDNLGYTFPDLAHPLYWHPWMEGLKTNDLSGGVFCNGLSFIIGKDMPYDLISIDVRVPPVSQIYNMASEDAWIDRWGYASVSPYKPWRESGDFQKGVFTYGDRMECDCQDMEDAFVDNEDSDKDEGFVLLCDNIPFECNAFYLNNHYLRLFGVVDPSIEDLNVASDGYTMFVSSMYDNEEYNHGKDNDEWLITVGFTHPRPHHQPCVILYKNNSIEIRIKSEYDYVNDKDKTGIFYKQEILEVFLVYMTRGGKRDKILSVPIRQQFNEDYIIHDSEMIISGDECVDSHVLIVCKKKGTVRCYLNGRKVIDKKISGNNSSHLLQKTKNETNNSLGFEVLVGHKRTGDDCQGKCVDFFHGYIYDIGIFPYCPYEFEINLIYRSLKLDHDIHLRQHWDRQQHKYKQEYANLNFNF